MTHFNKIRAVARFLLVTSQLALCVNEKFSECRPKNVIFLQKSRFSSKFQVRISCFDHVDGVELARRAELPTLPERWRQLAAGFAERCLNAVPPVGRMIQQDRGTIGVDGSPLGFFRRRIPFGPFNGGIADR